MVNSGTILATGVGGLAISATTAIVNNSGIISGGNAGISAGTANVINSGTISGAVTGISVDTTNVTNSGTITATGVSGTGISAATANVINSGTISATGTNSIGIDSFLVNVTNTGTISASGAGAIGINANRASTVVNSATIIGMGVGSKAIQLSANSDTLTLLPGSQIFGAVDMGGGADVVNVVGGGGVASLVKLTNFAGTVNTRGLAVYNPTTQQIATLDGTAFAQADRGLMDIAGGASSLVSGRLNNISSSANGMMAMAYAPDESNPRNANAKMFTKAPAAQWNDAPYVVWTNGFGGQRTQDATDQTLHSTSTAYGGAIGIDRRVRPDWLLGVFAGGGAGNLSVDRNVQKVDSDYGFGGGYSRFEWGSQFLDVTVQAGSIHNKSTRQVADNIAGLAIATASYNGWFVSPEVAYGYRINMGNGITLTPTARLRYVAGMFDGYNETGSAQNLSVGSRTLQDFEERGELEVSRLMDVGGKTNALKVSAHGGIIALQRAGDTTVNTVLIGQNFAFAAPGKSSAVGGVLGLGFDYQAAVNVALFAAVEGIAMSDQSHIGTAKGGVRVAF